MRAPPFPAALAVLLAGCAAAPGEPEAAPRSALRWDTAPDPTELNALRERAAPWSTPGGAACLATIVRDQLDVAHALLATDQLAPEARAALLAALPPAESTAWLGQPAPWRRAEELLARAAAALEAGGPVAPLPEAGWPTASQGARAAYLQLGVDWREGTPPDAHVERALSSAGADWAVAQRLEEMRALGGFSLAPARERAWHVQRAEQALVRGRALVAMQHAAAARVLSAAGAGDAAADRALLARAYLAARQTEAALSESESAAALARTPVQRARAEALRGQAMLLAGDPGGAAEAFGRAKQAALEANDEAAVLRHALNRAVSWLKAGEPERTKEANAELRSLAVVPVGPEAPDLLARRAIIAALAALLAGELDPNGAAAAVEVALARAREAGVVAVLDSYAQLPDRLRSGKPTSGR